MSLDVSLIFSDLEMMRKITTFIPKTETWPREGSLLLTLPWKGNEFVCSQVI
jgi:hypothetical protein